MPPGIHLPEAILGMDITLGEEQVMRGAGVNVWDPHFVAVNIDGTVQTIKFYLTISLWEGFRRDGVGQIALKIKSANGTQNDCKDNDQAQPTRQKNTNSFHYSSGYF